MGRSDTGEDSKRPVRLLSFLGLGPTGPRADFPYYSPSRYVLGGAVSGQTPLPQVALLDLAPEIEECVLFGTEKVRSRWIESGDLQRLWAGADPRFCLLPDGADGADGWKVFEALTQEILGAGPGSEDTEFEVWVDVTHGFRAHPIVAMSAVQFAMSSLAHRALDARVLEDSAATVVSPPRLRILYAAFEARFREGAEERTPIWDLTAFVEAAAWNDAVDGLVRYGRADALEDLTSKDAKDAVTEARRAGVSGRELKNYGTARDFGRRSRAFADDLATARLPQLLEASAPSLENWLSSQAAADLGKRIPPLRETIKRLARWLAPLASRRRLHTQDGLRALAHLCRVYGALERFPEQAVVLREGLIVHWGLLNFGASEERPGTPGYRRFLTEIERAWSASVQPQAPPSPEGLPMANRELAESLVDLRNDVEHGGLRDNPRRAQVIREALADATLRFAELADTPMPPPTTARVERVGEGASGMINLSNHPVASWTAEQRAAANAIAEPFDAELPLPIVPPGATEEELEQLVETILERTLAANPAAAAVFGEPTLSYALVGRLQARGIPCYAATTERTGESRPVGSGEIERRARFRFVRWRRYPSLHGQRGAGA